MGIGRTNAGGGGSGGILTVSAPAGVTVTAAKDGKTYTKTANASGVAVFKGLASGTWTVSYGDASQIVEVVNDSDATIPATSPDGIDPGCGLNFAVLRFETEDDLLAATPKENTIGIISDTEITGYHFGTEEPSPAAACMVWITTGTESAVDFNALGKNALLVYPLSAKQYVSGAWADVTAKSYQGGEWVDWITKEYIYKDGEAFTDITVGPGAIMGTDNIYIDGNANTLKNQVITTYQYGIGGKKKLCAVVSAYSGNPAVIIGLATTASDIKYFTQLAAYTQIYGTGTVELDISSINGNFNILISVYGSGACNITKWYFES